MAGLRMREQVLCVQTKAPSSSPGSAALSESVADSSPCVHGLLRLSSRSRPPRPTSKFILTPSQNSFSFSERFVLILFSAPAEFVDRLLKRISEKL